jgi:DUF4097 and DUF4098 domain-containing protein YvlB
MKLLLRAGAVGLAGVVAAGCVVSVDSQGQIVREEKRFSTDGTPDLHLSTFDGSIQVDAWDNPGVLVEIEKRGPTREAVDALVVNATQRGRRIEIEVKRPSQEGLHGLMFHMNTSAKLIVSVPRRSDIVARSGDGSIATNDIEGRLELRTGDGAIRAARVSGELILDTGDGSVVVDGAEGRLQAETGDGGVNVRGRLSAVRMHTGDGSIVYRAEPGASMSDDWDISTGDGSVALYVPTGFDAELDAHTGDGAIRNGLDAVAAADSGVDAAERRRTVRARLGQGGHTLRIRTGDGSITLKSR